MPKTRARTLRSGQRITLDGKNGPVIGVHGCYGAFDSVLIVWTFRGVEFSKEVPANRLIETHTP